MTSFSRFTFLDLFKLDLVNLDHLTETYAMSFYSKYLTKYPEYFVAARHPNNTIMGYIMGKVEGDSEDWHGHVSAVTVAPPFRQMKLGATLMAHLEGITNRCHNAYFVDLFVRKSNSVAVAMYERLGYVVYRRVLKYYGSSDPNTQSEDALDMRKPMDRHATRSKSAVIPLKAPIRPQDLEWF